MDSDVLTSWIVILCIFIAFMVNRYIIKRKLNGWVVIGLFISGFGLSIPISLFVGIIPSSSNSSRIVGGILAGIICISIGLCFWLMGKKIKIKKSKNKKDI